MEYLGDWLRLLIVAGDCRRAQKSYFKYRCSDSAAIAKAAESHLDALLDRLMNRMKHGEAENPPLDIDEGYDGDDPDILSY